MKNLPFTIILIFFSSVVFAQNFEGKVVFLNSYKSKMKGATTEQLEVLMGKNQEYFIKEGNYKMLSDGTLAQWQLYINKDNRLYYKMSNSEIIQWSDAGTNGDSVLKAEIKKDAMTILGYSCDEITLTCISGVQKYYYNPKISVDPGNFEAHKYGNWYELMKRIKSLPLKSIIDNSQFTLEMMATDIKPQKLDAGMFKIPENAQLQQVQN